MAHAGGDSLIFSELSALEIFLNQGLAMEVGHRVCGLPISLSLEGREGRGFPAASA